MSSYDTLLNKDALLVAQELGQTSSATSITIARGLEWLEERLAPGPIMVEPDLNYVYKTAWAFLLAGKSATTARLLDWVLDRAVQESGDLFLPEVEPSQGIYRQSWLLRTAASLGHPLGAIERVRDRMRQYQDSTGGVADSIGEDPRHPDPGGSPSAGATAAFGEFAIAAALIEDARRAGDWLLRLVEQNEPHFPNGEFYFTLGPHGLLDTEVPAGMRAPRVVGAKGREEPTWILAIATAFLVDLYAALRDRGTPHDASSQYLEGALRLFAFDCQMPLDVYFSWNRCKMAWSSGRLLEVLTAFKLGDLDLYDSLYRCARRTYRHTFLGTRLADGSWGHELHDDETAIDQQTLEGISAVPTEEAWQRHRGHKVPFSSSIEITSENVVMTLHLRAGIQALEQELSSSAGRETGGGDP